MIQAALAAQSPTAGEGVPVATVTIRNLDDGVYRRLRVRAAENGRSMEAEARAILEDAVAASEPDGPHWVDVVREHFSEVDPELAEQWHAIVNRPRTDWVVSPGDVTR